MERKAKRNPPSQRRIHGAQLPFNYQQVAGWALTIVTTLTNILLLIPLQNNDLNVISNVLFVSVFVFHIIFHMCAIFVDPSEPELRKQPRDSVPEFDRALHSHVIENGRCHLCNVNTSSKKTKHCSTCNKCVFGFDHHCKWLNHCVGQRNYWAFILTVITALALSLMTSILCIADIVFYFKYPYMLSATTQFYVESTESSTQLKKSLLLSFLITYLLFAILLTCAFLHLLCFHVYIFILGVSTYEYIVHNDALSPFGCCKRINCKLKKNSVKNNSEMPNEILTNNGNPVIQRKYLLKNIKLIRAIRKKNSIQPIIK